MYAAVSGSKSVWSVARDFGVDRGFVQTLLQCSAVYAYTVSTFCAAVPKFWALSMLCQALTGRLAFGVPLELVPLMELRGIKVGLARALASAGFDTLSTIARATSTELVAQVKHMTADKAENVISVAKESLRERAEEVLLGLA